MRDNDTNIVEDMNSDSESQPVRKRFKSDIVNSASFSSSEEEEEEEVEVLSDSSISDTRNGYENNILDKEKFNAENDIKQEEEEGEENNSFSGSNKMEAFNIEKEMTTGYFDKQGNYISYDNSSDNEDENDIFNGSLADNLQEIQKVADAHKTQLLMLKKRERQILKNRRKYMLDEALTKLLYCIKDDDTVLETLSYFNSLRKSTTIDIEVTAFSNAIDLLTDLIEILEKKGINDVYDLTRPKIKILLEEEESLSRRPNDDKNDKVWSFRWITGLQKTYQFYSNYEMNYWKQHYFKGKVIVKYKDDDDIPKNWIHISCVNFM